MRNPDDDFRVSDNWMAELAARYAAQARERGPLTPRQEFWATVKDRLAILLVLVFVALFGAMMFDTAIRNGQCDVIEFVTFKCNRWAIEYKPWDEIKYRD